MKKSISIILTVLVICAAIFPGTTVTASAADTSPERVAEIIDEMSVRDKVTQMMMVDFRKWGSTRNSATDFVKMNDDVRNVIENYNFGSVILFANNIKETEQSFNLVMEMQKAAAKDDGIPLLISTDQEGGRVYRLGSGSALPGNMALGATYFSNQEKYAYDAGKILGSELSSLGINNNLSPVVDVNNNPNNPVIGLRSYSDDSTVVGNMAAAVISGMQEHNVVGCAKHFPGHGDTATDSHYGLPVVDKSLSELREVELKPYEIAIEQGIDMIMTAHILYPQLESDKILSEKTGAKESLPATMSDDILTDLLKKDMGFEGIITTDSMNMAGVSGNWNVTQATIIAINAGVDMVMMPYNLYCKGDVEKLEAIIQAVVDAVESGEIPESRIDDAVTRILTVKEKNGILAWDAADYSIEKALATVGSDSNRQVEREIAAAAVTVVKNDDNVLPLDLSVKNKVLCILSDESQCAQPIMAWNRAQKEKIIPSSASIDYYCIDGSELSDNGINTALKIRIDGADTVIVYSEITSVDHMAYKHWKSDLPNEIVKYAESEGLNTVVVSCDKPYDVQLYPDADAVMAVYGCKPSSVDADDALKNKIVSSDAAYGPNLIAAIEVALGTYGASGKLPVDIPEYDAESNSYQNTLVYNRGFGLTYDAKTLPAFTKQPAGKLVSSGEYSEVSWETNFEPVKCIIKRQASENDTIDINPGENSITIESSDEQYIIRAYFGSGSDDYIESEPFNVNVCAGHDYDGEWKVEKPAKTGEDGWRYRLCVNCGKKSPLSAIKAIYGVNLSYTKKVYTGSEITAPAVTVLDVSENVLKEGTDYDVTGLENSTEVGKYTVTVTFKGKYEGEVSKSYTIVPKKPASANADLSRVSGGYDDIKFSWKSSRDASGYKIYYKKASAAKYTYITSTDKTSYTKKNLTDGVKYTFKVVPYYKSGTTKYSDGSQYRTASVYTLKKIAVPAVTKSGSKVKVKWKNINGETGYQISRSTSKTGTKIVATYKTTSGTYKTVSAVKGKKYYYKVRAYKVVSGKRVYGPWSSVKSYKR